MFGVKLNSLQNKTGVAFGSNISNVQKLLSTNTQMNGILSHSNSIQSIIKFSRLFSNNSNSKVVHCQNEMKMNWEQRRNNTYYKLASPSHNSPVKRFQNPFISSSDALLTPSIVPNQHTILQFTDLHHYNDGSREDREGIHLIKTLAERVKPDLVVFTGDIIDGRYCGSYKCFRNVVAPLVDMKIPWTYVPGNHDDETKAFSRKDLLNIYSMPLCMSKNANSFNHTVKLGPIQIYLLDSHAYVDPFAEERTYDFIKEDQISWYLHNQSEAELGLAFFHIPLLEYKRAKVLKGTKGEEPCTPKFNSGFFGALKKKRDVHALFTGHDHWNDFVSELDGIWLCYGRVSGFTQSTYYGEGKAPIKKERGGRVIRYDSSQKLLSTWVETKKGVEHNSLVSKDIISQQFSVITE